MTSPYRQHVLAAQPDEQARPPVRVRVYDRGGVRVGTVGSPRTVGGVLRDHDTSTIRLEVDADHHLAPALKAPGARVEVDLRGSYHCGGWMVAAEPTSGPDSVLGVDVLDYEGVVGDLLAWPVPAAPLTGQAVEQWRLTGPAEDVVKALIRENAARQGRRVHVFVAPSQGRGEQLTLLARMERVDEVALAALEQADLRIVVKPAGPVERRTGLLVDVVPRTEYRTVLTEDAGIVVTSAGRLEAPTLTRVVIGGGGEGVDRDFRSMVDTAREDAWGREIEDFRDARDARSELDEARREYDKATEDIGERRRELGEAVRERRSKMAEERAEHNRLVAQAADRMRAAEISLLQAETARDRLPSTATQAQKDASAEQVRKKQADFVEAQTETAQEVAESAAALDTEQLKQNKIVNDATKAADAAVTLRLLPERRIELRTVTYEAELVARMRTALAEGAPKASVSVRLSETATFAYGRAGLVIGARVHLGLGRGVDDVVERLRTVEWSWSPGQALDITPQLGDAPPDIEDKRISAVWKLVRVVGALTTARRRESSRR